MSFLYRLRLLTAASLLLTIAAAQVCFYPDGLTVSSDIPCNSNAEVSSCCPSDSFCMDNGLCFGGGVLSRASCTDQTWESAECAQYCSETDKSSAIPLAACDADTKTFTCGLNNTQCGNIQSTFIMSGGSALVLRPSQVEALTAGFSAASSPKGHLYSAGTVVGVALGIGLPLLFALVLTFLVLRKERQRIALKALCDQQPPPTIHISTIDPRPSFSTISRSGTMTTIGSTYKPQQPRAFMEKYGYHKGYYAHDGDLGVSVFELPGGPPERDERVEAP